MGVDIRLAGTRALSWRRLRLLCERLVQMPGTALWRQLRGADADWTVGVAVDARAVHALEVANWQRGADAKEGKAKRFYPKPLLPPSQQGKAEPRAAVTAAKLIQFRERTGYARGA